MLHFLFRAPALAVALAGVLPAFQAHAHVTLQTREAPAGGYYKAVFKVPHGCGGEPTTAIRVQIPEGVIAVKPQPKTGWQIELEQGAYDHEYVLHGKAVRAGVRQVAWSGGSLPDEYYDEFVFQAYLAPGLQAGSSLYFPLVQECGSRSERWTAAGGQSGGGHADHGGHASRGGQGNHGGDGGHAGHGGQGGMTDMPAPALRLLPPR